MKRFIPALAVTTLVVLAVSSSVVLVVSARQFAATLRTMTKTSVHPQVARKPPAPLAPCTDESRLTLEFAGAGGDMTTRHFDYSLVKTGAPCTLSGFPAVSEIDVNNSLQPLQTIHTLSSRVSVVTVGAREVSFSLDFKTCGPHQVPLTNNSDVYPNGPFYLIVQLPGLSRSIRVLTIPPMCRPQTVIVSPVTQVW